MKNLIFTFLLSFIVIGNSFGQVEKDRKWSVEIGGSYGQLYSKTEYDATSFDTTIHRNWTKFRPMPTLRIARTFETKGTINSTIRPFIGFAIIGTETDREIGLFASNLPDVPFLINATDYEYYYIPTIELGSFIDFPIGNFEIGIGLKTQYHLQLWTNDYYIKSEVISTSPFTVSNQNVFYTLESLFTRLSANGGLRFQYNLNPIFIATEGWYGLINISKFESQGIEHRTWETNLRLMLGYKF